MTPPPPAPPTVALQFSPAARSLLKLLFGLTLIGVLVWRLDVQAISHAIGRYRWPHLLAATVLFLASCPVAAWRWKLFAPRFSLRTLLELTLIGQFYSIVLPGQIAGELVKAYRLAKGNVDAERLAASVFVDRVVGMIALLVVSGAGLVLSPHKPPKVLSYAAMGLTLLLLVGLLAFRVRALFAFAICCIRRIAHTRLHRIAHGLEQVIHAWHDFSRTPRRLLLSLALGIGFQFLLIGIYSTLGANLGIDLSLADWAWISGIASIAVLLPLSIGGLGIREGTLIGCLAYLGVPGEPAVALSLGIFAIMVLGALLGGAIELCTGHSNQFH